MCSPEDVTGAPLAGVRVLVVEDDPDCAELVADLLCDMGAMCGLARDAASALEVLGAASFDLLFTDVRMPGAMDGLALARHCARAYPAMRVLVTSGWYAGMDDPPPFPFIGKPYRCDDLCRAVSTTLGRGHPCV